MRNINVLSDCTTAISAITNVGVNGDSTWTGVVGDYYLAMLTKTSDYKSGVEEVLRVSGVDYLILYKATSTSCALYSTRYVVHIEFA